MILHKLIRLSNFSKQLLSSTLLFGLLPPLQGQAEEEVSLTPVMMQFDWIFNAQFAGFYQAIEQGYFAEEGLDVELRGGLTTPSTVDSVIKEPKISFGSTESNVLIAEFSEGKDVRAIGTMFQSSPMGWMYVDSSGITAFTDLATRRVGVHVDGVRVIRLLLEKAGADLSELDTYECGYDPNIVIEGEADAMQCYYIDEFVRLQNRVGDAGKVFLAKDYGYEAYSQVMFTRASTIEEHPEVVEAFLRATKKGWEYAFAHPEATVDLILEAYSPDLERTYQLGSLQKIEELMRPEMDALFRPMSPAVIEAGQAKLYDAGLIKEKIDAGELLAQDFLP